MMRRKEAQAASAWKMSAETAAQFLEVDVATITQWAMEGKIPAIGEESGWKFDRAALEAWVNQQESIANTGGET